MKHLNLLAALLLPAFACAQNIAIGNITVTETDTGTVNMDFPITVTPVSATAITLSYATAPGSATSGTDFTAVTAGSISIPINTGNAVARVVIASDVIVETLETLTATISNASSGTIVTNQGLGQITDNDAAVLSIASLGQAEGNSGSTPMPFIARLSNPVQGQVRVTVNSANGTATAGSDYTALAATVLTFPSLSVQQAIPVGITGDTQLESDESFILNLSALEIPVGISAISLSPAAIVGTIQNDDSIALSINDVRGPEGTANPVKFNFTATLSSASAIPVSVNFATVDDTAISPSDYTGRSGTLTFAPGELSKTTVVTISNDNLSEPDERFHFALSAASAGATLPARAAIGTIENDDFVAVPGLGCLGAFVLIGLMLGLGRVRG